MSGVLFDSDSSSEISLSPPRKRPGNSYSKRQNIAGTKRTNVPSGANGNTARKGGLSMLGAITSRSPSPFHGASDKENTKTTSLPKNASEPEGIKTQTSTDDDFKQNFFAVNLNANRAQEIISSDKKSKTERDVLPQQQVQMSLDSKTATNKTANRPKKETKANIPKPKSGATTTKPRGKIALGRKSKVTSENEAVKTGPSPKEQDLLVEKSSLSMRKEFSPTSPASSAKTWDILKKSNSTSKSTEKSVTDAKDSSDEDMMSSFNQLLSKVAGTFQQLQQQQKRRASTCHKNTLPQTKILLERIDTILRSQVDSEERLASFLTFTRKHNELIKSNLKICKGLLNDITTNSENDTMSSGEEKMKDAKFRIEECLKALNSSLGTTYDT